MSVSSVICARSAKPLPWKIVHRLCSATFGVTCAFAIALPTYASSSPIEPQVNTSIQDPSSPLIRSALESKLASKHKLPTANWLANPLAKGNIAAGELSLSGLDFYTTESDIVAVLGPPKSREALSGSVVDEVLYFGGISVALAGGQVWDIIATSPKFCTPSGICPGDSLDLAFNILGPTEIIGEEAIYTAPSMGSCLLSLGLSGNTISQIKLACP